MFSSHAGAATDAPLLNTNPGLYSFHKSQAETAQATKKGVQGRRGALSVARLSHPGRHSLAF